MLENIELPAPQGGELFRLQQEQRQQQQQQAQLQQQLQAQRNMIVQRQNQLQQTQREQEQQLEELERQQEQQEEQQQRLEQQRLNNRARRHSHEHDLSQEEAPAPNDMEAMFRQAPWLLANMMQGIPQPPPLPSQGKSKTAKKSRPTKEKRRIPAEEAAATTDPESASDSDSSSAKSSTPTPPGEPRSWESESETERKTRHAKYATMAACTETNKTSIQQQSLAMIKSVIGWEDTIKYFRSLKEKDGKKKEAIDKRIEEALEAHSDLVKHLEFLGVAYDHGWETARIFGDNRKIGKSKEISAAVKEAKQAKEKKGKALSSTASSSAYSRKTKKNFGSGFRYGYGGPSYWPAVAAYATQQQQIQQPIYQPQAPSFLQPQRRFGGQRSFFCFRCGENTHGWQTCPKSLGK